MSDDYVSSSPEYRRIFNNTPCEQIAKAILRGDSTKIDKLVQRNLNLVNYQDSVWGQTLLMYAVYFNRKDAVSILLRYGADPNIHEDTISHRGDNSILIACFFDHIQPEILELLLKNGGNPNSQSLGVEQDNFGKKLRINSYAIQIASGRSLQKVKLLYYYGGDMNLWIENHFDSCPVISAALSGKMEILFFLLEHNADFNCDCKVFNKSDTTSISLCEILRRSDFALGSKEHFYKMKVVDILQKRGVDYYSTPIPNYVIEDAKRKYPDSWQEYLQKY